MLYALVNEAREGMTAAAVAVACERDPHQPGDIDKIEAALKILLEDGLAEREADPGHRPNTARRPETAGGPETPQTPDSAREPATADELLYRPTRAAIRANELSF